MKPTPVLVSAAHPAELGQLAKSLSDHPLYGAVRTPEELRVFCGRHVFCVWDFMSLLKSLQRDLTCTRLPWTPCDDPEATRLINEIVLGEESDVVDGTRHLSHFSWYLEAMAEIGADTGPIQRFLREVKRGTSVHVALEDAAVPPEAAEFVRSTFATFGEPVHVRAAVFFYGREDLIPRMFLPIVKQFSKLGFPCGTLLSYLERHIDVDGGEHGPMAEQLLVRLFAGDSTRAAAAHAAASTALEARRKLWDATLKAVREVSRVQDTASAAN